ncbi:Nicastrin [Operophtera brumata]|uniref:Nicastrin n=1 Tax=Operophtera brumata TaxID=104452 RepID=A0A0L7L4M1_OPEBR|nr:Nicastrin [Operophtera brumata]
MIRDIDDAKWLVTDAAAGPYMAVVNTSLFNNVIELFMENPDNIAGVLVYNRKDNTNNSAEPESQCSSTNPSTSVWNAKGSGLLRRDVPFTILFSSAEHYEDIDKIEECYERYNKDKDNQRGSPLCSIEMNSFMSLGSSLLTPTKMCDPIDVSPGASSSVVGMVTLVSTATLLSKMIPDTEAGKYGVWPAHAPLSPDDIQLHVEVGQIGGSLQNQQTETPNPKWPMYAFTPNDQFNKEFNESVVPQFTPNIPPSSVHSFRRILTKYTHNDTLPELVLVDHADQFTNMYYNSALDEYYQLGYDYRNISIGANGTLKISRLATALAYTLYNRVVGAIQACPLMQAADYGSSEPGHLSPAPPYMYASVAHYASNPAAFTGHLLVLLAGTQSVWRGMSARVFVSAGGAGATSAVAGGVCTTLLAAFLTFWMKKHKDVVFYPEDSELLSERSRTIDEQTGQ